MYAVHVGWRFMRIVFGHRSSRALWGDLGPLPGEWSKVSKSLDGDSVESQPGG
jgi:hypothetical protein